MISDGYYFKKINQKMLPPLTCHGEKMDKILRLNGGLDEDEMKFVRNIGMKEYSRELEYKRYEYTDEEKKTINKMYRSHINKKNKFYEKGKK